MGKKYKVSENNWKSKKIVNFYWLTSWIFRKLSCSFVYFLFKTFFSPRLQEVKKWENWEIIFYLLTHSSTEWGSLFTVKSKKKFLIFINSLSPLLKLSNKVFHNFNFSTEFFPISFFGVWKSLCFFFHCWICVVHSSVSQTERESLIDVKKKFYFWSQKR